MNMFGRKEESRPSGDRPARKPILETPAGVQASGPADHSAPTPMKPSIVSGGPVPSAVKSSLIAEGFEFTGDMKSDGSLVVGGRAVVDGKLSYHTVAIQRGGTIKGDLERC